jgi:hypothetical protein
LVSTVNIKVDQRDSPGEDAVDFRS